MFGHQNNVNDNGQANDATQHGSDSPADGSIGSLEPETIAPTASTSAVDDASIGSYVVTDLPETVPQSSPAPAPASPPVIPHPVDPSGVPQATPPPIVPTAAASEDAVATPAASHTAPEAGDLLSLKQSALHELSPLLGHLEQTPEEKFRTTMMMIQASDDHTMLQSAYEAAKTIKDEKARAQALLDVVNEINYFTQATAESTS